MAQYAFRIIIAVIGFLLFIVILPLFFDVLGISLGGSAFQLIKICAAVIALAYVIWGPPVPFRSA
jgi:hypothetical protein